jgi:hypothetical protein
MTQASRCYSMAERRAAGFATHTPLDQYPETIFERDARTARQAKWWMVAAALALVGLLGWVLL